MYLNFKLTAYKSLRWLESTLLRLVSCVEDIDCVWILRFVFLIFSLRMPKDSQYLCLFVSQLPKLGNIYGNIKQAVSPLWEKWLKFSESHTGGHTVHALHATLFFLLTAEEAIYRMQYRRRVHNARIFPHMCCIKFFMSAILSFKTDQPGTSLARLFYLMLCTRRSAGYFSKKKKRLFKSSTLQPQTDM